MAETFRSKALEKNLRQTREAYTKIPDSQKWFGELSKSKWGIYKRTQSFLKELNHLYRNNEYVIESLHSICLEDLWFYNSLAESEKALNVLVEIFELLLDSPMEEKHKEQLITTLLEFIDRLSALDNFPGSVILRCLNLIEKNIPKNEILYIRNSGYFRSSLDKIAGMPEFNQMVMGIASILLDKCINYWDETTKAEEWFESKKQFFPSTDIATIDEIGRPFFEHLRQERQNASDWESLCRTMFYNDIANYFRSFTEKFESSLESIYYLYYLLHLPGMTNLYDYLLYDLNRYLRKVFKEIETNDIPDFLDSIMRELGILRKSHPRTVIDCIVTLGKEIIYIDDKPSITHFIKSLAKLGFNYPGELSLNHEWQIQVNSNHVKNIRAWIELICQNPPAMKELIENLIVNLKLGGIFISDTDLFQREVTKLLNSDIAPVYREMKQLAKIFPVYFREIGAEGELRKVTSAIDDMSMRKDELIHFLRVSIHTESNNTHIELTKKIILYWKDGNKERLEGIIPDDIYARLDTSSKWFEGVHLITKRLFEKLDSDPFKTMQIDLDLISSTLETLKKLEDTTNDDFIRVSYIFQIYSLIVDKYSLATENIISEIKKYKFFSTDELLELEKELKEERNAEAINKIYKMMRKLKSIILDPEESKPFENIYYKRHIAFGIPSMYGQYIEPKFEALGLMYRLEITVSNLMVKILLPFKHEYITAKTLRQIYDILALFKDGLELDGIVNHGFNSHLDMFKFSLVSPSFSLNQYINIFHMMAQDIKQITREYFIDTFEGSLNVVVQQLLEFQGVDPKDINRQRIQMESEKFYRDNLASAFLIQELDNFITETINTLRDLIDNYSSNFIENMLTYNPDITFSPLSQKSDSVENPVFLGAKAFVLKKLISLDYPVPPGFVITTEAFRHKDTIMGHPDMRQDFNNMIKQNVFMIEKSTGREFGNPNNPLFFSVRSGSFVSLPGAMMTFLNVGINDEIAEAFSKTEGFAWTAWDCYRRFLQSWGMAYGVHRDTFDQIMTLHKDKRGVDFKIQFKPEHMKDLAMDYKNALLKHGIVPEEDPYEQLRIAIRRVWDSWYADGSVSFRNHMQIADEWGTAVTVQKMVLGNRSSNAGSGVVFTSDPFSSSTGINLYGDFAICSQGEDVVAGLVHTLPISESQRKKHYRESSLSLESGFPRVFEALNKYAKDLIYKHGFMHQEIEFTFESDKPDDLYILQTRNQKLRMQKSYSSFVDPPNKMKLVGRGIGVSSGVLTGLLAFDMEDIKKLRGKYPDKKIILVRPDTVPDDIPLIFACDGLVTAKGGITSHAAVTAASTGKICIVKCTGLIVNDTEKKCIINGHVFSAGDAISIDGSLGNIYEGYYEIAD